MKEIIRSPISFSPPVALSFRSDHLPLQKMIYWLLNEEDAINEHSVIFTRLSACGVIGAFLPQFSSIDQFLISSLTQSASSSLYSPRSSLFLKDRSPRQSTGDLTLSIPISLSSSPSLPPHPSCPFKIFSRLVFCSLQSGVHGPSYLSCNLSSDLLLALLSIPF